MVDPLEHGLETRKGRRIVELALQGPRMFEKSVWKRPAGAAWAGSPGTGGCIPAAPGISARWHEYHAVKAQVPFLVPDGVFFNCLMVVLSSGLDVVVTAAAVVLELGVGSRGAAASCGTLRKILDLSLLASLRWAGGCSLEYLHGGT